MACPHCGGNSIEYDPGQGNATCTNCGAVSTLFLFLFFLALVVEQCEQEIKQNILIPIVWLRSWRRTPSLPRSLSASPAVELPLLSERSLLKAEASSIITFFLFFFLEWRMSPESTLTKYIFVQLSQLEHDRQDLAGDKPVRSQEKRHWMRHGEESLPWP